ncbi:MAG: immunity protein YezG family protein [Thalassolituus sp.]|uniref:immunity protein YezG family protein n=1 Tax=Thalassolituus sp. TaxID=2030822 RepID=UPI003982A8F3
MTRKIDDIYLDIAQDIVKGIDTKWDQAYINVEFFEDAGSFDGEFIIDGEVKYFEVSDETFDFFEEIYKITTENNSSKWNRAKFTLAPSGEFEIDFEWDQALADEIESNS